MGYVHLNPDKEKNDGERNAKFGFNTLLAAFNRWLEEREDFGVVIFDRMEWSGAFDYCVEKHTKGLTFPPQFDRADQPLNRILSFSMASANMSHICSVNDVAAGALHYVANVPAAAEVRGKLMDSLVHGFFRGDDGKYRENSLFYRPKTFEKLDEKRAEKYKELRDFLNANY